MCGISGVVLKSGSGVDRVELERMNTLISHRGPDGEGYYYYQNIGFGHRRLAILDLSEHGHQPMFYLSKYVITYNGEIYNFLEIKQELLLKGYSFISECDTEVILAAYDFWGEDCVTKFNGMWSFAIHDTTKDLIFCSRDRFGVKPFYYNETSESFKFGSEIKQLLNKEGPNFGNKDLIAHYLLTGMHDHDDRTFFEGILKLPPSHNLIYNLKSNTKEIKRYYSIPVLKNATNYEELLISSVKFRLRSDVKVGTCLSGGLDSSTIASIASGIYLKESKTNFNAIHARSSEASTDESAFANIVATHSSMNLHTITPKVEDFKSSIKEVVTTQEEPFGGPSIFMQYFVMKEAKNIGCKVMLDGQGGDETLLGYKRYYSPILINLFMHLGFFSALKQIKSMSGNIVFLLLKTLFSFIARPCFVRLKVFKLKRKSFWFKDSEFPLSFPYFDELNRHSLNLLEFQKSEIFKTNLQALLRYEDKNSMKHGVEARLPYLDYRVVESALNLPVVKKYNNGWTKFELRTICEKFLPSRIAWRKDKLGFDAPDRSWLENLEEVKPYISKSKLLKHFTLIDQLNAFPLDNDWSKTWRIINLAIWESEFNVELQSQV